MFVAKDNKTGTRVTSLDPAWKSRFDELRALTVSGQVVCPGCQQAVRFRVGERRRPHFAHRVLSECPLSKQSAEVLEAKAQLYEWLCTKYPEKVELDVDLHITGLDRVADVVVRLDDTKVFAYWVFDHTPRDRYPLQHYVERNECAHVLYTQSAQKLSEEGDALLLPAALRDFIRTSGFDKLNELGPSFNPGHLCFLDTDHHQVMIYRGVDCIHLPNRYDWRVLHKLDWPTCKIAPRTGEVVADGEKEWKPKPVSVVPKKEWHPKPESVVAKKEWYPKPLMSVAESTELVVREPEVPPERPIDLYDDLAKPAGNVARQPLHKVSSPAEQHSHRAVASNMGNCPLKCEICGETATDYSSSQPGKGTCVCRNCFPAYSEAKRKRYLSGEE